MCDRVVCVNHQKYLRAVTKQAQASLKKENKVLRFSGICYSLTLFHTTAMSKTVYDVWNVVYIINNIVL